MWRQECHRLMLAHATEEVIDDDDDDVPDLPAMFDADRSVNGGRVRAQPEPQTLLVL